MPTLTLEGTNKKIDAETLRKLSFNAGGENKKSKSKLSGVTASGKDGEIDSSLKLG